jgi:Fe-S oxidoreductase
MTDGQGQGVDMAEIVKQLRIYSRAADIATPNFEASATHCGLMETVPQMQLESPGVRSATFLREDATLQVAPRGQVAYFVGCLAFMGEMFYDYNVEYREIAKVAVHLLNKAGITPVVLDTVCCGHDSLWAGDLPTFTRLAQRNVDLYKQAGVETIVCSCAEGYRTWKFDYPSVLGPLPFKVKHITEVLAETGVVKKLRFPYAQAIKVTYHDPCRLGRIGGQVYDAPRQVLAQIPGVELVEMAANRDDADCCGIGAFRACNEHTKLLRKRRVQAALVTGAQYMVTTCPKCETHFNCLLIEPTEARGDLQIPPTFHMVDLLVFLGKALGIL